MASASDGNRRGWPVFVVISGYLIAIFLYRFFIPADEYPMRASQVLDISLDVLLFVSLVGLRMRLEGPFDIGDSRRTLGNVLFGLALAAGIGLFLIRFSSDAAWWTGHRLYSLDMQ